MSQDWLITVQIVHLLLIGIVMAEGEEEDDTGDKGRDGNTRVHPLELGVDGNRHQRGGDGGTKSVGEQVETLDERLHRGRGLGVGVLQTSDRDENLCETDEDVRGGLDGNVDVVRHVHALGALPWGVVARTFLVDQVLNNSGVGEAERGEGKANGDTSNGAKLNASAAKDGVDDAVKDGSEDQNGDRVEVLH